MVSAAQCPKIAVIAAGAMGAAIASKLTKAGCIVYTDLDGRSEMTRLRAQDAGMQDASLADIIVEANWILSILPPRDAVSLANKVREAARDAGTRNSEQGGVEQDDASRADLGQRVKVFVDCNAVSPETAKQIGGLFADTDIKFIDACIIGPPPRDGRDYGPTTIYASAAPEDIHVLNAFVALSACGLKIFPLTGEGADVGDASALKMSYAGISKGTIGLYTTIILAAHASSPATAEALINELHLSQPMVLERVIKLLPAMPQKAYRWVREMEEISQFVGGNEGETYKGLARTFERVEKSLNGDEADIQVLRWSVQEAVKVKHLGK